MSRGEVISLAEAAHAAGVAADRAGANDWEAHEKAARAYVEAAKHVRDEVTRRAVALVGHAHAKKAAAAKEGQKEPPVSVSKMEPPEEPAVPAERQETTKETGNSGPEKASERQPSSGGLWVGDLLALERRLHGLGVKGVTAPAPKKTADVPRIPSPRETIVEYVGAAIEVEAASDASTRSLPDAAASREEALTRALKRLSDENAALRRRCDELEARDLNRKDAADRLDDFKVLYQRKFEGLKNALDDFRRVNPAPDNPANALASPVDPDPPRPYSQLDHDLRLAKAQLKTEREVSRKKDAVIERYEHWYRALKASATKRTSKSDRGGSGGSPGGRAGEPASACPAGGGSSPGVASPGVSGGGGGSGSAPPPPEDADPPPQRSVSADNPVPASRRSRSYSGGGSARYDGALGALPPSSRPASDATSTATPGPTAAASPAKPAPAP